MYGTFMAALKPWRCPLGRQARGIAAAATTGRYPHKMVSLSEPKTMDVIINTRLGPEVTIGPLPGPSKFLKPVSAFYSMDGKSKRWDLVESLPSVAVALYHADLDSLVVVRQFRPAVYAAACREANVSLPVEQGFTYELCAGLKDKQGKSEEDVTSEEIEEECGFRVPPSKLRRLTSFVTSAGISGVRQTLFAARVDDSMRVSGGGGVMTDGEAIEVLAVPMGTLDAFLEDDALPKSAGLQFAAMWLLRHGPTALP